MREKEFLWDSNVEMQNDTEWMPNDFQRNKTPTKETLNGHNSDRITTETQKYSKQKDIK